MCLAFKRVGDILSKPCKRQTRKVLIDESTAVTHRMQSVAAWGSNDATDPVEYDQLVALWVAPKVVKLQTWSARKQQLL